MDDIKTRAFRILANNRYMVLSTSSSDGKPWSTPVFYAFDDNYNFYWYSRRDTKHSQLIKENDKVAVCIFGTRTEDEGFGVYIEGSASELIEAELQQAMEVYANKGATNDEEKKQLTTIEDFQGDSQLRMYKLVPNKCYVSNESTKWNGKWIDSRSEINLNL